MHSVWIDHDTAFKLFESFCQSCKKEERKANIFLFYFWIQCWCANGSVFIGIISSSYKKVVWITDYMTERIKASSRRLSPVVPAISVFRIHSVQPIPCKWALYTTCLLIIGLTSIWIASTRRDCPVVPDISPVHTQGSHPRSATCTR